MVLIYVAFVTAECTVDTWLMYFAGDFVLAEWKDERYYQAIVTSIASDGIDVKFANKSVMSVPRQNLAKCSQIPVGCTVLAKTTHSDWYEPAVIHAYYRYPDVDSQQQGYTVLFSGQTSHTRYSFFVLYCR